MLRIRMRIVAPLAVLAFAGCAYLDPDPEWANRAGHFVDAALPAPTDGATGGIDPPAPAGRIENGDCIVYAIEFAKGDERRSWVARVEVVDAEHEPRRWRDGSTHFRLLLDVRVVDDNGSEVGRDRVVLARDDLVFGLFRACRGDVAEDAARELPAAMRGHLSLRNMLEVVRRSKVLFGVLQQVVDRPSIWSVIANFGVTVWTDVQFDKARRLAPVERDGQQFAVYEVPVELLLNRMPALRSKVLVTEPNSPLNLSAGILAVDAFQPSDPTAHVTIRVRSARRRSEPQ